MLTQLTTLKLRLGILDTDNSNDAILSNLIEALHTRFDNACSRTFARSVDTTEEFDAGQTEILVACYPIEGVTIFETKSSEASGWQEIQPPPDFLIRSRCIISLSTPLNPQSSIFHPQLARVTYTGGYILPGANAGPGQALLPADLEQATLDQAAFWFDNRARLGLARLWEYHGTYRQFASLDLLPSVTAVLARYRRILV